MKQHPSSEPLSADGPKRLAGGANGWWRLTYFSFDLSQNLPGLNSSLHCIYTCTHSKYFPIKGYLSVGYTQN